MRYSYIVLMVLSLIAWTYAEDLYSDKYDYVKIEEILENDRLREQYYKCFMDTGPCLTPDATFFKDHMSDAFATKCKKCTELQKTNFDKLADWYTANQPDQWKVFVEKMLKDATS